MAAPNLASYVDHAVLVKLSSREAAVNATLCGIDEHGLWLESAELTDQLLGAKRPANGTKPVLFAPFTQVHYVIGALDTKPPITIKE